MTGKLLIIAAVAIAAAGCGGKPVAVISGNVSYEGQPVDNGSIAFLSADGQGPTCGGPIAKGTYRVENVPPGKKMVQIIGIKAVHFMLSREEMEKAGCEAAKRGDKTGILERADTIPSDAKGNNAVVEVLPGRAEMNFALKKPASRRAKDPVGRQAKFRPWSGNSFVRASE